MTFGELILDSLSKRIVEYIGNDLQLNIQNVTHVDIVKEIQFSDQTACISVFHPNNATIAISTSFRLSELILRNFINVDIFNDEINEFAQASLAETLNITLGNIIQDLPKEYGEVTISPPFFLEPIQTVFQKDFSEIYMLQITIENEIMLLSYFI
ncbi:MAG: chemotaxis protein CheX [Arcobacteraceae bacterium]|nr:chemotaxis protein CheX [Arcobacteraceae bacterium]